MVTTLVVHPTVAVGQPGEVNLPDDQQAVDIGEHLADLAFDLVSWGGVERDCERGSRSASAAREAPSPPSNPTVAACGRASSVVMLMHPPLLMRSW